MQAAKVALFLALCAVPSGLGMLIMTAASRECVPRVVWVSPLRMAVSSVTWWAHLYLFHTLTGAPLPHSIPRKQDGRCVAAQSVATVASAQSAGSRAVLLLPSNKAPEKVTTAHQQLARPEQLTHLCGSSRARRRDCRWLPQRKPLPTALAKSLCSTTLWHVASGLSLLQQTATRMSQSRRVGACAWCAVVDCGHAHELTWLAHTPAAGAVQA